MSDGLCPVSVCGRELRPAPFGSSRLLWCELGHTCIIGQGGPVSEAGDLLLAGMVDLNAACKRQGYQWAVQGKQGRLL